MTSAMGNGGDDFSTANGTSEEPPYMAARPKFRFTFSAVVSIFRHGLKAMIDASPDTDKEMSWQQMISIVLVTILWRLNKYMKKLGFVVEWSLNLLKLNGGLFGFLYRLLLLKWGEIIWPQRDSEHYLSISGLVDSRETLFVDTSEGGKANSTRADSVIFPADNVGSRSTADVCVMAAKLAYENAAVIERVVTKGMKMHFKEFFDCWNEYQHMKNTQAFVFMDKPTDAKAVVVAFRGTEPFNGYDWSTDLDFSWVTVQGLGDAPGLGDARGLGSVHLGFLEALGLGTRDSISTFLQMRQKSNAAASNAQRLGSEEAAKAPSNASGLAQDVIDDKTKPLAYDDITKMVSMLLQDNPKAKLFVTGHSLGGALAVIYSTLLHFTGDTKVADKIAAVYTFGQPRVGDQDFAEYANSVLKGKYFRVVYCNDIVPRIPSDNHLFSFRHFGDCAYFNSVYDGSTLQEAPNPNFFGFEMPLTMHLYAFTMHLNAFWEFVQAAILMPLQHGDGFRETKVSLLCRLMGLALPGIAGHSPTNYVNSVRLGPLPLKERLKGDIADAAADLRHMLDNLKDIAYVVFNALPALPGLDVVMFAAQKFFGSS